MVRTWPGYKGGCMTPEEIHAQTEMDKEIVHYVREIEITAPVRAESVHRFLKNTRRHRVTERQVELRLNYLVDKGYLKIKQEWEAGEGDVLYYEATAKGTDAIDGVIRWGD